MEWRPGNRGGLYVNHRTCRSCEEKDRVIKHLMLCMKIKFGGEFEALKHETNVELALHQIQNQEPSFWVKLKYFLRGKSWKQMQKYVSKSKF